MLDSTTSTASQLSCGCLKPLTQVDMFPERYSQGMATMTSLRKIEAIQVNRFVERGDAICYVIDVFLQKSESRIPTNNRSKQSKSFIRDASGCESSANLALTREPDFQVERCFSEFIKLRSAIYRLAQTSHSLLRCQFCNDVVNSILLSSSQPKRFMNLLFTRNVKARILHKFMNSLMDMTLRSKKNNGCRACEGQEQIPQLLFAFLQPANSDDS
ncbi:hypothetical protein FI667_g3526, partial [Globisporangium splendens]